MRSALVVTMLFFLLATSAHAGQLCFPLDQGDEILRFAETQRACLDTLRLCEDLREGQDEVTELFKAREMICRNRLDDVIAERDRALIAAEETAKRGEEGIKKAQPKWYARVLSAGKWILLGGLVGFAAGAGR